MITQLKLTEEMPDYQPPSPHPSTRGKKNPMLVFGAGPEGRRCRDCAYFFRHSRYFKCKQRTFTFGPGTDHRANWTACKYFEEREE